MAELNLYLLRHGIAVEGDLFPGPDRDRPLTAKGERKTREVAREFLNFGIEADLILSSPLLRAHQTSQLFLEAGVAPELAISDTLAPAGSFGDWLQWLDHWRDETHTSLMLVGHEPNLSHWTELLLWGKSRGSLQLKKAGVIGLTLPEGDPVGNSLLFWLTPPKFILKD
ncbi:phosphohistidine phosphatase SixA [Candidatus Synechococcus calcipolaris G9]|uniref:Phosphohistidine phosphatase SixA n=1 Tax=Candidatus Synechococcus calcipolaris G9 TaxID=1497997 RepID=A0ABT6EZR4_9SYNE|nr:phosphohistidine phosphatase SixA [Candidatus Synechococcus calcipolaris]MDG2991098.1 phosphohistidine phosphatase SixA [Candidatus Synechococcus calcipolaris G9]